MSGTDQEQSEVVIEDTDKSKQEGGKRMSRTEEVKEQSDAKNKSAPTAKKQEEKEKKKMKEGTVEFCVPWTEVAQHNPNQWLITQNQSYSTTLHFLGTERQQLTNLSL